MPLMHRSSFWTYNATLLLLCVFALSCTTQRVSRSVAPCPLPPPPPPCSPATFDAVSVDTSSVVNGMKWTLRRVDGARTHVQEWALLPFADKDMLLSGSTAATSRYDLVQRTTVDQIELTKTVAPIKTEYITIVENTAMMGDASVVQAQYNNAWSTISAATLASSSAINVPISWDGHPTLSSNGQIIVFASDRATSSGGTDLWYAIREGQQWSEPQLLVGGVNTPCDELSPFFVKSDSALLFASAGHSTVGGYDLFEVDLHRSGNDLRAGSPRNLGKPINSEFDELFPRTADKETLYFSSDRPAPSATDRKDFDVFVLFRYRITTPPPSQKEKPTTVVTGTVVDKQTNQPVSDANVTARDVQNNEVVGQSRTDTLGEYAMNVPVETQLEISAQAPDLFFDEVRVIVPKSNANDTFNIEKPLSLPEIFILRVNFPTAIFDDPYQHTLDSNGVETSQDWQEALDLLAKNVMVSGARLQKLLLIGHTDDVDDDASNMVLGRNRVNFVMNELVRRGVRREMLEGRSAGETMLLSRRKDEPIDLWRKRARRVELVKVLHK